MIAAHFDRFLRREVGVGVARPHFYATSTGCALGVTLTDGRRVVVKAHQPRTDGSVLAAVQRVQAHLGAQGFPAPAPVAGPARLGVGVGTVEVMLDRGVVPDARAPGTRAAIAAAFHRLVTLTGGFVDDPALARPVIEPDTGTGVFPRPHSPVFDFEATTAGAEWIEALAVRAAAVVAEDAGPPTVVTHVDFRAEHLRVDGERLVAVYDWDSVRVDREAVAVGQAAHAFTDRLVGVPGARPDRRGGDRVCAGLRAGPRSTLRRGRVAGREGRLGVRDRVRGPLRARPPRRRRRPGPRCVPGSARRARRRVAPLTSPADPKEHGVALTDLKGQTTGTQTVVIERGPVRVFAEALGDTDDVYRGDHAPVPPTFPFVMSYWGSLGTGGAAGLPIERLRGPGRAILHGEQAFDFRRWPHVGDVLEGSTVITDVSEKERANGGKLEFYVTETRWRDATTGEDVLTSTFTLVVNVRPPA